MRLSPTELCSVQIVTRNTSRSENLAMYRHFTSWFFRSNLIVTPLYKSTILGSGLSGASVRFISSLTSFMSDIRTDLESQSFAAVDESGGSITEGGNTMVGGGDGATTPGRSCIGGGRAGSTP